MGHQGHTITTQDAQATLAQLCETAKLMQTSRLVRDAAQMDDTLLADVQARAAHHANRNRRAVELAAEHSAYDPDHARECRGLEAAQWRVYEYARRVR